MAAPPDEELRLAAQLIAEQRWAALATLGKEGPFCSWVAYVPEPDFTGLLLHLSGLAPHTRNLSQDPRCTLAISELDSSHGDPQTLARISIEGTVEAIAPEGEEHARARQRYLQRLPDAAQLFEFGDFQLFRLRPARARYIGGFARAFTLSTELLRRAAGLYAK